MYSETIQRSSAEALAAAYERGAKARQRDRTCQCTSKVDDLDVADLPFDQRRAYADGWLDMFKAESTRHQPKRSKVA